MATTVAKLNSSLAMVNGNGSDAKGRYRSQVAL
jgi:hypothetical protein